MVPGLHLPGRVVCTAVGREITMCSYNSSNLFIMHACNSPSLLVLSLGGQNMIYLHVQQYLSSYAAAVRSIQHAAAVRRYGGVVILMILCVPAYVREQVVLSVVCG